MVSGIYFIRMYCCYIDDYVYKIGYSENIKKRLRQINYEFGCEGEIVIVMIANLSNKYERRIHSNREFIKYRIDVRNNFNCSKGEIYKISHEVYDLFYEFVSNKSILWESQKYVIDDYDYENYDCNTDNSKLEIENIIKEAKNYFLKQ